MFEVNNIIEELSDKVPMYSGNEKKLVIDTMVELWSEHIYIIHS